MGPYIPVVQATAKARPCDNWAISGKLRSMNLDPLNIRNIPPTFGNAVEQGA